MTTTEEKIKVMQAYVNGEQIEMRTVLLGDKDIWTDWDRSPAKNISIEPEWDWGRIEYRIKPKLTYRPYKDTEEMIADFKERFGIKVPPYAMPLVWVKSGNDISLITAYRDNSVFVESVYVQYDCINLKMLFDMCEYLDGSQVGKLVEE